MTSKAAKLAKHRRAALISLSGGSVDQRPTGRDRRHINQPEDARKTATEARQRQTGIADPKEASEPILSTDMGCCVHILSQGEERTRLANTWEALSASRRNYRARIIGRTGEPQSASLEMIPDRMETDQSLRVDMRTSEEKDSAARASWAGWQVRIDALPTPMHKWAIRGALDGFLGEATLWKGCAPTDKGRVAVDALRRLEGK